MNNIIMVPNTLILGIDIAKENHYGQFVVFKDILEANNFIQSLSRKGTPIDNSPMESFFGTLKIEVLYNPLIKINNDVEIVNAIKDYIKYYNNERIQKSYVL